MDTISPCRIEYHFFKSRTRRERNRPIRTLKGSIPSLIVSIWGRSRLVHITVKVETLEGVVFVHSIRGHGTVWSSGQILYDPDETLVEYGYIDTALIDMVLPPGERYSVLRTVLYGFCGAFRHASNCVTVAHRIRFLMGKQTNGRSPGSVYREIKGQQALCE